MFCFGTYCTCGNKNKDITAYRKYLMWYIDYFETSNIIDTDEYEKNMNICCFCISLVLKKLKYEPKMEHSELKYIDHYKDNIIPSHLHSNSMKVFSINYL